MYFEISTQVYAVLCKAVRYNTGVLVELPVLRTESAVKVLHAYIITLLALRSRTRLDIDVHEMAIFRATSRNKFGVTHFCKSLATWLVEHTVHDATWIILVIGDLDNSGNFPHIFYRQ